MEALLPLVAMFGLMWLLLIRPQQRRMRQHQAVVAALEPGDEVITAGGLHGTVTDVEDGTVLIEISPDVIVRVLTGAISQRLTPPEDLDDDDDEDEEEDDDVDALTEVSEGSAGNGSAPAPPASPGKVGTVGEDQP